MEYLQVFDDDKNLLDEKVERNNKLNLKDGKRFMIVLVFIENSEHKFLVQKTSKERNSEYAITGGHVTYKDTSLKTVIKELKEELGVIINESQINYFDTIKYPKAYADLYYIKKDLNINKLNIQKEEVDSIIWLSKDEIIELINKNEFRKGNIEPLNKFFEYIKNR